MHDTATTSSAEFIGVLPFQSQPVCDDPEFEIPCPVDLWKSAANICEGGGSDRCDDSAGLYYTLHGDETTFWCPRHWYENHLAKDAPYRLLDMTEEQYGKERAAHRTSIQEDWKTVSERIRFSAAILSHRGLQEEAGKILELHGYLNARFRRM